MMVERLNFKDFSREIISDAAQGKVFQPSGAPPVAVPQPPAIFSEDDIKTAERNGYQKGFLDGVGDGRRQAENEHTETERLTLGVVSTFLEKVAPMLDYHRRICTQLSESMPKMALSIARKAAGNALDQNAHEIIMSTITRACEMMMHEARLNITVHEKIADMLTLKLHQLADRMPAATQITVIRNPDMPVSDCKIEWDSGAMERSQENIWQQIEKTIDELTAASQRDSQLQLDMLYDTLRQ